VDYTVWVKPGSSKGPLVEVADGALTVYLHERAVDGAANAALIAVLAKHFGIAKTQLSIVRSSSSRHKIVRVPD
jgi:uncharacterized protein